MIIGISAAFVWIAVGTVISLMPQHNHWYGAIILMICFLPVFALVWVYNGWIWAILFLCGAASYLRYPVFYMLKFLWCKATGRDFEWPSFGRRRNDDA